MPVSRIALLSLAALSLTGAGCASIVKGGGPQSVSITSSPDSADVKVIDLKTNIAVASGKTPMTVALKKEVGFFQGAKYKVVVEKAGHASQELLVDSSANGWYIAGNLVFGGFIGWLIVDPATGAMWTLDPDVLNVTLQAKSAAAGPVPVALLTTDELRERHPELVSQMKPLD